MSQLEATMTALSFHCSENQEACLSFPSFILTSLYALIFPRDFPFSPLPNLDLIFIILPVPADSEFHKKSLFQEVPQHLYLQCSHSWKLKENSLFL